MWWGGFFRIPAKAGTTIRRWDGRWVWVLRGFQNGLLRTPNYVLRSRESCGDVGARGVLPSSPIHPSLKLPPSLYELRRTRRRTGGLRRTRKPGLQYMRWLVSDLGCCGASGTG